jgi:uncharacterized protein (DUF697 family)
MKILKTVNKARKILRPMSNLKDSQSKHSESVIRNHVLWSMGAGAFIPVPFLDSLGVAAIQLDMVRQLSRVYNLDFEDTKYKAIVSSILGTFLARAGAKSLIKLIPIAGSYIGGAAMGILSGASTYTLGELFKNHFENGGTMLDVDIDRMKRQFSEKFEKNKDVVKKIRNEHEKQREEGKKKSGFSTPVVDENSGEPITDEADVAMSIADELKKLAELKDAGVITETEFDKLKTNLIDKMM